MTKQPKALAGSALVLMLSILISGVSAVDYTASFVGDFQNNSYLGFRTAINLSETPHLGVSNISGLVGYWNANEGSGNITHDSSGNGNNGTLYGPVWVNCSCGSALSFDGVNDYVQISNRTSLILRDQFTLSFQFSPATLKNQTQALIGKSNAYPNYEYYVYLETDGRLRAGVHTNSDSGDVFSNSNARLVAGGNYSITITWIYPGQTKIYINGNLQGSAAAHNDPLTSIGELVIGDLRVGRGLYSSGVFDNIRVYNRTLSATEVVALYLQPDPTYSDGYFTFQDSTTNNTLLIHVDNADLNSGNSTLVTCTDFFADNRLTFTANNSATLILWSNLERPVYTTGTWNSNTYTTTLTLNDSSIGELDWNHGVPPSASLASSNSSYAGNATLFCALWTDNRSLSGGGYIFSTNNTGQWVNASWVAFSSTPCWGNATLTLKSKVGSVVGFREFANNSFGFWGDSGIYDFTTTNGTVTPTSTPSSTPIIVSAVTPTPNLTPATTSTGNQTATSTLQHETNSLATQTIMFTGATGSVLIALTAFAFKKGYIKVEVIEEESNTDDENKQIRIGSRKENADYSI